MQTNLIIEPPNEKQKLFLLDHHRVVGFGGARGGGKSWVFRAKAKLLALKHGGITIVIVRKTYPELTQNHIEPLCNELNVYSKERLARYSDKDKKRYLCKSVRQNKSYRYVVSPRWYVRHRRRKQEYHGKD